MADRTVREIQNDLDRANFSLRQATIARQEAIRAGDARAKAQGDANVKAAQAEIDRLKRELRRHR